MTNYLTKTAFNVRSVSVSFQTANYHSFWIVSNEISLCPHWTATQTLIQSENKEAGDSVKRGVFHLLRNPYPISL